MHKIKVDELVKSRHSGEDRSPDKLEPFYITGFRPPRLCHNYFVDEIEAFF